MGLSKRQRAWRKNGFKPKVQKIKDNPTTAPLSDIGSSLAFKVRGAAMGKANQVIPPRAVVTNARLGQTGDERFMDIALVRGKLDMGTKERPGTGRRIKPEYPEPEKAGTGARIGRGSEGSVISVRLASLRVSRRT
jgi:hypothetical protein